MSALTFTVIQFAFLALLWIFVLVAVSVMRSDLFGSRVRREAAPARAPRQSAAPRQPRPQRQPKPSKPGRGTPATLVIVEGNLTGTKVPLGGQPITVGRASENQLVLDDDYVSGKHARFYAENGRWFVEDIGSTNGTHVGSHRITSPTPLNVGTSVRFGKTVVEVRK